MYVTALQTHRRSRERAPRVRVRDGEFTRNVLGQDESKRRVALKINEMVFDAAASDDGIAVWHRQRT
jgi:hypothetical protein